MDQITTAIARFAAALAYEQLPPAVIHAAKQRLIDSLACAIGGRDCAPASIGRRVAAGAVAAVRPGRIIVHGARATAEEAAFVNTTMIRYLDFNDTVHGGHPSDALGAVFALADGVDGRRLVTGMVVAYEVATRLIASSRLRERGWDQGFAIGIAAAAAAGHVIGLDEAAIAHAVAITTVANVPLRTTRAGHLSMWKGAATAFACRNGVFAALLAGEGMTGPEAAFAGRNGAFEQVSGEFTLLPFADGFLTPTAGIKYWPVENTAQAAVWAALKLRETMPTAAIAAIDIATYWAAFHEIASEPAKWDPQNRETADHSMPYIFARALVDGTISLASFAPDSYLDPALRPLMAKIRVRQDEAIEQRFPAAWVMLVTATDHSGGKHQVEIVDARGHPRNPMSDAEIVAKFRALAEPALGPARVTEALEALWAIERETSAGRVLDLLDRAP